MNLLDFLLPLRRNKILFLLLIIFFSGLIWFLLRFIPDLEKTTIYFTIKPLKTETQTSSLDPVESSMKIAETIAGWAKNPAFRQAVLNDANIQIPNFKRKLSARKQNRTNVFWTLSLYGKEKQFSKKITNSLIKTFKQDFEDFNKNNSFPFATTTPKIYTSTQTIPQSWKILISILLGIIISIISIYSYVSFLGKLSFTKQIKTIFPNSPTLIITKKIGAHNVKLLEQFLSTFPSPKLIGTFSEAENNFDLIENNDLNIETDTPILIVQIGKTKINELKNQKAIFGEDLGIIIFER